jgi:hypothetical protein
MPVLIAVNFFVLPLHIETKEVIMNKNEINLFPLVSNETKVISNEMKSISNETKIRILIN